MIGINFSKIVPTLSHLVTGKQSNASMHGKPKTMLGACEILADHIDSLDSKCDPHVYWLKKELISLLNDDLSRQELAEDYDVSIEFENLYF